MSYTNHTTHYELPQWVRDDKPTFLSDLNGAFDKIDRGMHANANGITDMEAEVQRVEGVVDGFGDRLDTAETKISALETSQGQLEQGIQHNAGDINTINSLIGNGEPTTQDKTIIGAINELAASGTPAEVNALKEKVGTGTLDTTSQNCVGAINEVNTKAGAAQTSANTANSKADANANKIGAGTLDTTAQTLIGAINEVNAKPSGGGDTVTITPALSTGTKVADYTINGVGGSLYAPTSQGGGGLTYLTSFTGTVSSILTSLKTYLDSYSGDKIGLYLVPDTGSFPTTQDIYNFEPVLRYQGKDTDSAGNYMFGATVVKSATNPWMIIVGVTTKGKVSFASLSASGITAENVESTYNNYTWRLYTV